AWGSRHPRGAGSAWTRCGSGRRSWAGNARSPGRSRTAPQCGSGCRWPPPSRGEVPVSGAARVLVVDDHPGVRRGLRTMLDGQPWVERIVEAATVAEALREAVSEQVNVVAMDVALPDGDGVEAIRRILLLRPGAAVLMLTMTDDPDVVTRSLRAGAR